MQTRDPHPPKNILLAFPLNVKFSDLVCYSVPFRGTPRPPGVHRRTEATAGEWGPVERRPFGNMGTSWTKTSWKQAQGGIRNISSLIR